MLNADFRIDAGFPALPATGPAAGNAAGDAGAFSRLYRDLHTEVRSFIENGSGTADVAAAGGLSPEGVRAQLQLGEAGGEPPSEAQQAFLRDIEPMAREAGQRLGVAPDVLAAHAALESGWGQRPIRREDGSDSHNLFGLKAGASWRGEVAETLTTEYTQGQPEKRREGFRSYADHGASFRDLTQLLLNNPRYQAALQTGGDAAAYGQGLQRGGFATDPAYADKLARVAARIKGAP